MKPRVAAVNADGSYGRWVYAVAKKMTEVNGLLDAAGKAVQDNESA